MRCPQLGQNFWAPVLVAHLGQIAPVCVDRDGLAVLALLGRGSSATAAPHRAHCGTPIGVSALHASQTSPTSIKLQFYPLSEKSVKDGAR
jgi:hypothetical protein